MADTRTPPFTEERNQNKAKREIPNEMSHYRIEPIRIKITDPTGGKKGGQGVVAVGTLRLHASVKDLVSWWKAVAEKHGISPDELKEQLPELKETLNKWSPETDVAVEMVGMPPEALEEWVPEMEVAVKMLGWSREDAEEPTKFFKSFIHELSLMAELYHPNIIQLVGFVEDIEKGDAWMILPWEGNGNVREFLQSGEWDLPERLSLIKDTAKGLEYLHGHQPPICHGDLKSLNILVNSSYRAVITDFGSARIRRTVASGPEERENRSGGAPVNDGIAAEESSPEVKFNPLTSDLTLTGAGFSLRWTAPEVLRGEEQDLPSDMWAIGWICWETVTGKIPFEDLNTDGAIIMHTINGKLPAIREDMDLSHVLLLCSVMSECWLLQPAKRIDASAFQRKVRIMPSAIPSGDASGGQKTRSAHLLNELGRIDSLRGENAGAVFHYQSALDLATQTKDELARGNALNGLADIYRAQSKYLKAEQTCMEAHEIHSRIGHDMGAATALDGLGAIYRTQSKHCKAEKVFMDAHEIHSRISNDLGAANALDGLGETYRHQSKHREAEKAFMESHGIHSRIGNDQGAAVALNGLGEIYRAQSKYREAKKAFIDAHRIHSRTGNDPGAADALNGLGEIYRAQLKHHEAEKAFMESHEIHSRIGNDLGAANALNGLGQIYMAQLKHPEAETAFIEAHEIYSRIDNDLGAAYALNSLGEIYCTQSKHDEAEKALLAAHKIHSRIGNNLGVVNALLGLGNTYGAQSRNREAEKAFNDALKISLLIDNHLTTGNTFHSLGNLYRGQYRCDQAEVSYRQALAAYGRADDTPGRAKTLCYLGGLYDAQGRYFDAEEAVAEGLAIWISLASEEGQVVAYLLLASIFESQSKYAEVMDALIQVGELLARTGKDALHAEILHQLGDVNVKQGMSAEAEECYRLAQAIFSSMADARGEACALLGLGDLYVSQGRHDDAEECFAQARIAYAIIADEDGEAKALDNLVVVYVLQRKFGDAKAACIEACETYAQRGKPVSEVCVKIRECLQDFEEPPLGSVLASFSKS